MVNKVEELLKTIPNSYFLNQATNTANPEAHFKWTGTNIRKKVSFFDAKKAIFAITTVTLSSVKIHFVLETSPGYHRLIQLMWSFSENIRTRDMEGHGRQSGCFCGVSWFRRRIDRRRKVPEDEKSISKYSVRRACRKCCNFR